MTAPESLAWQCQPWSALDTATLYRILAARQAVFVVEQQCPYLDLDGVDAGCHHLWLEDAQGQLLAYARLLPPGVHHSEASIGRVLTTAAGRGAGLGRSLMLEALQRMRTLHPGHPLRIDAQQYLEAFYTGLGFQTAGAVFDLDGIPHVEMVHTGAPG